ncbi:peptidoglycan editing factor PgeF [Pelagibacteraceae bacterium]|nr:peptidoglycan editing factor PgeF [Pelagibacteraceae bacterium]
MNQNYYSIKKLNKKIIFGFFNSKGGVSKGNYNSLNCSSNNSDKKENVLKNIKISIKKLGIKNKKLKLVNQIHSNRISEIKKENYKKKFLSDGLITRDRNIALGILTADCAPIFIFDSTNTFICCLHSGWKGTLLNISKECIKKLKKKKINNKKLIAVIGPCLAQNNFEVDKQFKIKFIKKNISYKKFFKNKNKNKDLFDLRGLIKFQLESEGVNKIYNIKRDTYKNRHIFFSHRRTMHQNKTDTGRMINIISFRG